VKKCGILRGHLAVKCVTFDIFRPIRVGNAVAESQTLASTQGSSVSATSSRKLRVINADWLTPATSIVQLIHRAGQRASAWTASVTLSQCTFDVAATVWRLLFLSSSSTSCALSELGCSLFSTEFWNCFQERLLHVSNSFDELVHSKA